MAIEMIRNIVDLGIYKVHCCYFDLQDFNITTGPHKLIYILVKLGVLHYQWEIHITW